MRMMNTREKRDEKKDIEDGLITAKEAWELQAWRLNRREAEVPEGSMTYYAKGLCYACGEPAMIGCRTPRERTELLLEVPTKPHACPLCGEQEALHLDVTATFRKEQ